MAESNYTILALRSSCWGQDYAVFPNWRTIDIIQNYSSIGWQHSFSNSAAIITDTFQENERAKALGLNQMSIVVGSVAGLVFGGFLTSYLGWRSIFWVNIPIGIFAIIWSYAKLKELGIIRKEKIDWLGNVTFATGLFLILLGVTFIAFKIIIFFEISLFIIGGFTLLISFVFIEKKLTRPMFNLSLFKIRVFTGGNIAIFLNALARGAFTSIMSFYLQGPSMKLNALNAGIYLIPVSIALATFAPLSGWLYDKYKLRILAPLGLLVSGMGFLSCKYRRNDLFLWACDATSSSGSWYGYFRITKQSVDNDLCTNLQERCVSKYLYYFCYGRECIEYWSSIFDNDQCYSLHSAEQLFSGSFDVSSVINYKPIVDKFKFHSFYLLCFRVYDACFNRSLSN